jgi:hypothetical protein
MEFLILTQPGKMARKVCGARRKLILGAVFRFAPDFDYDSILVAILRDRMPDCI